MKFSIVTVVWNDCVGVIRTLQSVFSQSWPDYEYIVQDGASSDGTSDVLRRYAHWIDHLSIEPDDGIYDAMNRALDKATGDYILFLNAADFFVDPYVLEKAARLIDPDKDDIFVGRAVRDEDGKLHDFRPPTQFWAGSTCDHQSTFIRRDLMQRLRYDTRYRISGDLEFFTRARKAGARFRHTEEPIARRPFSVGASSGFVDRVRDRLEMLEAAWGEDYPVRELISKELRKFMSGQAGLDPRHFEDVELEELLARYDGWKAQLPNFA